MIGMRQSPLLSIRSHRLNPNPTCATRFRRHSTSIGQLALLNPHHRVYIDHYRTLHAWNVPPWHLWEGEACITHLVFCRTRRVLRNVPNQSDRVRRLLPRLPPPWRERSRTPIRPDPFHSWTGERQRRMTFWHAYSKKWDRFVTVTRRVDIQGAVTLSCRKNRST